MPQMKSFEVSYWTGEGITYQIHTETVQAQNLMTALIIKQNLIESEWMRFEIISVRLLPVPE